MDNAEIKILIVDDEEPIRKLLSSFLREYGYQLATAEDVGEAKGVLRSSPVDLVVTDMNMPGESGLELINYINQACPQTAVVVATIIEDPVQAEKVLEAGVYGYIVKPFNKNQVLITVANAIRRHRLELGRELSKRGLESRLKTILDNVQVGLMLINRGFQLVEINRQARLWFDSLSLGAGLETLEACFLGDDFFAGVSQLAEKVLTLGMPEQNQASFKTTDGVRELQISVFPVKSDTGHYQAAVIMLADQTEKFALERELRQAQKLEAIGQLAAGIAHEINTPIQYVGDNLRFIADAFESIWTLISGYEDLLQAATNDNGNGEFTDRVSELRETADLDFLIEEIPLTLNQSLEGVDRVGTIVRSMKEFSHPGGKEKEMVDINRCLDSTLIVSKNEWKYVAETTTAFDAQLPQVPCQQNELNQVFLNLIINAAHAIGGRVEAGEFEKGLITVSTGIAEDMVEVRISDNGGGIPSAAQDRIFDPFFTTKQVGKGTGQGLAIARNIIVDKHGGSLVFETRQGVGTTFIIRLPLQASKGQAN